MVKALTAFKKQIQIGNEVTPGNAVAATDVLLGTLDAAYTSRVLHWPEDDRNSLAAHFGNEFKVGDETELTINMRAADIWMPWVFGSTIRGNITPTQPDATNEPLAYLWTYQGGLTTGNTPDITNGIDTFTIEYGDNLDGYETPYCFTKTLTITGAPNEPVQVEWVLTGAKTSLGNTPTAALTVSSAQYFPSNTCSFYIDTSYANIGNTAKTDLLRGWVWTLETMFTPRYTASGVYTMKGVNEDRKKVSLELEYARGTLSEVEKALHEANSTTYLRIKMVGDTEIDSSQSNPPYVYLDGAFHYTEWPEADDTDGMRTETVTAESVYDATGTRDFEVAVFTSLAAYPS
jgi:hypothetical protein